MATSFKRSHESTATLVPPALQQASTDPRLRWRLLDTHRQVWGQSLVGSLLVSPGSWCAQDSVCALQGSISQSCEFWQRCGGVRGDLLQEGFTPCPSLLHPEPLPLRQSTADLYLHRRCSNTATHWRDQNRTHSSGKCTVVQTVKKMFNCQILLCHLFDPYQLECQLF